MRRKIIAGNWKMNLDHHEGAVLASAIAAGVKGKEGLPEVVLIPSFTTLPAVAGELEGSEILTGAQDMWYEKAGAFTGEVSAEMLSSLGCRYVLVGHSERRHVIGEEAGLLADKLRAVLDGGLSPIYCVGELLEEREAGKAESVVEEQLRSVLSGVSKGEMSGVVLAYEPVWAIGTGKTATPEDASSMHGHIRNVLSRIFDAGTADETVVLYGGSVKPENATDLMSDPDIDGALVGGASLKADSFLGIILYRAI
ncbi:MAG: triose-phosphate isomerase [Bacteroidales bacterium]|nr:triose-phosphate isomerase [Candidatus Latescibacterota bacterium]